MGTLSKPGKVSCDLCSEVKLSLPHSGKFYKFSPKWPSICHVNGVEIPAGYLVGESSDVIACSGHICGLSSHLGMQLNWRTAMGCAEAIL